MAALGEIVEGVLQVAGGLEIAKILDSVEHKIQQGADYIIKEGEDVVMHVADGLTSEFHHLTGLTQGQSYYAWIK